MLEDVRTIAWQDLRSCDILLRSRAAEAAVRFGLYGIGRKGEMWMKRKTFFRTAVVTLAVLAVSFLSLFVFVVPMLKQVSDGAGLSVDWDEDDGTVYEGLSYGSGSRNLYDLYVPAGEEEKERHCGILFLYDSTGGEGSRSGMAPYCKRYAQEGYVTAAMEYSTIDGSDSDVTFYTILDEIGACIGALEEKAEELGCSLEQIALSGVSGGGHLALLYSYSREEESPLPIAFVFEETALTDFHGSTLEWNMQRQPACSVR